MCQCVARPAGDDEDGGHLSGVCGEEELSIEAGIDIVIQEEVADKSLNHQQFTSRERFRGPRY